MREERRIKLESMLDAAYSSGDENSVAAIRRTIERETLECTAHTAERIKRIETRQTEIGEKLDKVCGELRDFKATIKGAVFAIKLLRVIAAAGGGAVLMKLLTAQ